MTSPSDVTPETAVPTRLQVLPPSSLRLIPPSWPHAKTVAGLSGSTATPSGLKRPLKTWVKVVPPSRLRCTEPGNPYTVTKIVDGFTGSNALWNTWEDPKLPCTVQLAPPSVLIATWLKPPAISRCGFEGSSTSETM